MASMNKEEFTRQYSLIYKDLYRFALCNLRHKEEAEDAVSEAVVSAWANIHKLRKKDAFRSWMFQIVINECHRIAKKRLPVAEEQTMESSMEMDLAGNMTLWEAFGKIKEPGKTILSLSIFGGYNSEEISQLLRLKPGTVRSHKSRSLETLRDQLKEVHAYE